jgi:hypothetical protein
MPTSDQLNRLIRYAQFAYPLLDAAQDSWSRKVFAFQPDRTASLVRPRDMSPPPRSFIRSRDGPIITRRAPTRRAVQHAWRVVTRAAAYVGRNPRRSRRRSYRRRRQFFRRSRRYRRRRYRRYRR